MSIEEVVRTTTSIRALAVVEFTGRSRVGIDRWEYLPFEVPAGVRRITVYTDYDRFTVLRGVAGNVLDLGLFGPAGWAPDDAGRCAAAGFRGWSGGARQTVTVSATEATPGYLPGPIDPGTWAVAIGPVVLNPLGMRWRVRVVLESGEAADPVPDFPPPLAVPGRGPGWYRGDLHLHTVCSDGQRTQAGLAKAARGAGLDFIASTEHNTNAANRNWGAHCPPDLLVLPGEEVTTRSGHWLAVGLPPDEWVDWRYGPRDRTFPHRAAQVRAAGGLVVAAHPAVPVPGTNWRFGYRDVDAVEVWNGHWNIDDEVALRTWDRLLRLGRRVAAVGGSDSHAHVDPVGRPQVAVYADALSRPAIVDALRRGRAYLAESAGVSMELTARCGPVLAGPGEDLPVPPGKPVSVRARISGAPGTTVVVRTAAGIAATARVDDSGDTEFGWETAGCGSRFVRVEVRRPRRWRGLPGPMVALTNPVWLRPAA
jgi:predicted metal-dependent phosphoesterase TrpH